ncbi:MAG TPA: AAA family ATPase [Geobacterales bacterium]|nr:AAA family ATPase [Geobacterales bacterium]
MIVLALSGPAGSGKTSIGKEIAGHFNLRFVSIGTLFRQLASELNMDLREFHILAEKDYKYDLLVDSRAIEEAKKGNVLVEGHLACWILKDIADLRIYLSAPLEERARRVAERDNMSIEKALEDVKKREESNKKRYKQIYGINIEDLSIMDIIINTSKFSKEKVTEILISIVEAYLSNRNASNNIDR